jgi:hypothetical protein
MGMDAVLLEQAQRQAELRDHDRDEARLVVAGLSKSTEDCALLLSVLGLMDES